MTKIYSLINLIQTMFLDDALNNTHRIDIFFI